MRRTGHVERFERVVAADAVIGMNDEIARRQRRRLGDELVEIARRRGGRASRSPKMSCSPRIVSEFGGKPLFERQ